MRFYNKAGEEFVPTGGTLIDIDRIDMSGRSSALDGVEVVTMCDIDNPMYGPTGASHIFGPQKGADSAMVEELDRGVIHLCEVIRERSGNGSLGGAGRRRGGRDGRGDDCVLRLAASDGNRDGCSTPSVSIRRSGTRT